MYFIRTGPKSLSYCSQHCTNFYQTDAPTHHHNNLIFLLNCPTLPSSLLPAVDFAEAQQRSSPDHCRRLPKDRTVDHRFFFSLSDALEEGALVIESVLNNVALQMVRARVLVVGL